MWCIQCERQLHECTCPDLQDRLKVLGQSEHLALTYCSGCGEYAPLCQQIPITSISVRLGRTSTRNKYEIAEKTT